MLICIPVEEPTVHKRVHKILKSLDTILCFSLNQFENQGKQNVKSFSSDTNSASSSQCSQTISEPHSQPPFSFQRSQSLYFCTFSDFSLPNLQTQFPTFPFFEREVGSAAYGWQSMSQGYRCLVISKPIIFLLPDFQILVGFKFLFLFSVVGFLRKVEKQEKGMKFLALMFSVAQKIWELKY